MPALYVPNDIVYFAFGPSYQAVRGVVITVNGIFFFPTVQWDYTDVTTIILQQQCSRELPAVGVPLFNVGDKVIIDTVGSGMPLYINVNGLPVSSYVCIVQDNIRIQSNDGVAFNPPSANICLLLDPNNTLTAAFETDLSPA